MFLQKTGEIPSNTNVSVELEKMADDLLMITINNDIKNPAKIFNYWRLLGNGKNPPLEIGIDINKKIVHSITVFIEKNNFVPSKIIDEALKSGNIIVDTNLFQKSRYIDVEGLYFASINHRTFICIFNDSVEINERVLNGRVEYFITNNELYGFAICNLNDQELEIIKLLIDQ